MIFLNFKQLFKALVFFVLIMQKNWAGEIGEGFFFPVDNRSEDHIELKKADLLFEANFIEKAITSYKNIIDSDISLSSNFDANTKLAARFHLGLLYFSEKKYEEAISILQDVDFSKQNSVLGQNALFLYAAAHKFASQPLKALAAFEKYLNLPSHVSKLSNEAHFQMALINFELKNNSLAKKLFQDVSSSLGDKLSILASLYIARIDLAEKKYEAAEDKLKKLYEKIPANDPYFFELSFLLGEVAFLAHDYHKAISYFNQSLQFDYSNEHLRDHLKDHSWYPESLYFLGLSYLKLSENTSDKEQLSQNLKQSEDLFIKMLEDYPDEKGNLALAECYLNQAKLMKSEEYFDKAEAILNAPDYFQSTDGKTRALLLRAQAARTYAKRDALYKELTSDKNDGAANYSDGWYMRALNNFEEALEAKERNEHLLSQKLFAEAFDGFGKALKLYKDQDDEKTIAAIKYQAIATSYLEDEKSNILAFKIIDHLIDHEKKLWSLSANQDEFLYLHGYFAAKLVKNDQSYFPIAIRSLEASAAFPNGKFGDVSLKTIGTLYFDAQNYEKAEKYFLEVTKRYKDSKVSGDALFWSARCAELSYKDKETIAERKKLVFENYPSSTFAGDAYFTLYSYQEYLQGDKASIKHLQSFEDKFSSSPYLIETYYLLGLDFIRDRKTPEGKWIRKRSMTDAIDAFQHVETIYDALYENHQLPEEKKEYYAAIRYRSILHRAMANLSIAEEAKGAKQHIYLEYAEEVFKGLIKDLENPQNAYGEILKKNATHPNIYEEASYGLAKTYVLANNDEKADQILIKLIEYYKDSDIAHGYYPARTWDERGRIFLRKNEYKVAFDYFTKAEDCSKGSYLSTDQKLDLWMQQSLCHRGLKEYDDAILILSKVINDDAVSTLRMKAMYYRAETYELQGRVELAKKQLESMVKKGGSYAIKAKEKLEKIYGY